MQNLKRWFPFFFLLLIAVFFFVYMLMPAQSAVYIPDTADPDRVYRNACSHCHGENGQGKGLFYPALDKESQNHGEIEQIIREGALFMPAFQHIRGDTLRELVDYIYNRDFTR